MKKPRRLSKYGRLKAEVERLEKRNRQDAMCEFASYFADHEELYDMVYRSAFESLAELAGQNAANAVEKHIQTHMPSFKLADEIRGHALNLVLHSVKPLVRADKFEGIIVTIDFGQIPSTSVQIRMPFQI